MSKEIMKDILWGATLWATIVSICVAIAPQVI